MDQSSTYCVMPHMGMALQNHADVCCCNVNKDSWKDNRRDVIYMTSHPISTAFTSATRKIIAARLDNGIKHSGCRFCWDLEESGSVSPRQLFNDQFGDHVPMLDQPRVLIIKPGNTCNFACRMCNPMTSSTWYADGYELEKNDLVSTTWYPSDHQHDVSVMTFNEYTRTFQDIRHSFHQNNTEFWHTLKGWLPNMVYIDIYGGEPFLIPAMFDLLQHGVEIGASNNIEINIHTNASIFNQAYLNTLAAYKKVSLHLSLDSEQPKHLEYIRHKASFEVLIDNCHRFKHFVSHHDNFGLSITNTITPLNVFYVDRTAAALQTMFDVPVEANLVTTPEYDIRHLPVPVKQILLQQISNRRVAAFLQQTIPGCEIEWPRFCAVTDKLDQLRGQSFSQTFRDWWKILEPHWVSK